MFRAVAAILTAVLATAMVVNGQGTQSNIDGVYVMADVQYERGSAGGPHHLHKFVRDGSSTTLTLVLNGAALPVNTSSGHTRIRVSAATVGASAITVAAGGSITELPRGGGRTRRSPGTVTTGDKTVLVVIEDSCTFGVAAARDNIFGGSGDPFHLRNGMERCSAGQLRLNEGDVQVGGVAQGTGIITVDIGDYSGMSSGDVENAMISAAQSQISNYNSFAHVMYCFPPGVDGGGWVAYGYIDWYRTVYNNVSAQMHEIGHNLDLAHAGESGTEYADQSGMMGCEYSYDSDDGPEMCFNAANYWQMQQFDMLRAYVYTDSTVPPRTFDIVGIDTVNSDGANFLAQSTSVYPAGCNLLQPGVNQYDNGNGDPTDPTWDGNLANCKFISLKIHKSGQGTDFFVGFNHQVGINAGTQEAGNKVVIVQKPAGEHDYGQSWKVAELAAGQSYLIEVGNGRPSARRWGTVSVDSIAGTVAKVTFSNYGYTGPTAPTASTTAPPPPPPPGGGMGKGMGSASTGATAGAVGTSTSSTVAVAVLVAVVLVAGVLLVIKKRRSSTADGNHPQVTVEPSVFFNSM